MRARLFVDGSVDPNRRIGYGAMLRVDDCLDAEDLGSCRSRVRTWRFEGTSSSRLELETLLWALGEIGLGSGRDLTVFTDSETVVGLPARRERILGNGSGRSGGRELSNADLYRKFYDAFDQWQFELRKIKGHSKGSEKSEDAVLFTLVDRAARQALRHEMRSRE